MTWVVPWGFSTRPNNGQYNIFHDYTIDTQHRYSSDAVQFNRANCDFINELNKNSAFKKDMLTRYPKLESWLTNPNKSSSPPDLTWHHHEDINCSGR